MMQLSSAAQLGMPVTNQNHQVIFSNLGHFATNVNFHHVRIPVNLTTIMETPKMAINKIKAQNKNVYTMTIAELKNTAGFNKSDSLSQVIAQQAFNTAEDIATIAYSELDILQRQLISSTITLPSATTGRQERQLGLIFGIAGTLFSLYNYINTPEYNEQTKRNKQSIEALTHISRIQEHHLDHLDFEVEANRRHIIQSIASEPSLILAAANNVVFIANNIVSKFLSTITQLQIQRLSPLLLEGSTIVKIFQYLQNLAKSKNMDLLISQSSDLFQIDVTYYFNPSSNELNIFIHAPMVKPSKLLQLYKFIKFPLTQTTGHNITMMPSMDQDLLAVGEEYQYKLMDQTDFLSCKHYGTTFLCKDREVIGKDLATTCIGAYYLQDLTSIQAQCQFNMVPAKEYTFNLGNNKWLISTPNSYTSTLRCPSTFKTISIQTTTLITVPSGCSLPLNSITIEPDTNSVDNEFENKHYEWFWDSDVLFPKYNSDIFGEVLRSYGNKTAVSIQLINQAVNLRQSSIKHTNETVDYYLKELSDISNKSDEVTSNNTIFIIVMTLCVIGLLFFVFKIFCTSTHSKKPLFPSYRLREWTGRHTYQHPMAINEPNNDNIIRTQNRPTPENIELQTTSPKEPTSLYPSFSAVNY